MGLFDFNEKKAKRLHHEGQRLEECGEVDAAIDKYLSAIDCDPLKSESYYNIGLIYKYRGKWKESFEFNEKANEIDPTDEAARWNLAIAATALRNWAVARRVWNDNGLDLDDGSGPIEMDFGMTPVRLNPDDDGEVVWATRIDPVRARIESVPLPESGYRYLDIVLHDGAAVGYREVGGMEYPVFNALELFEKSSFKTCVVRVSVNEQSDLERLEEMSAESRCEIEDWTANIRALCRQCSEGKPHEHHDQELQEEWHSERRIGVAYQSMEDVSKLFDMWQNSSGGTLQEVIDD